MRGTLLLAVLAGCYQANAPAGAPCSPSGDCPSNLMCYAGVCVASVPDGGPPIGSDGGSLGGCACAGSALVCGTTPPMDCPLGCSSVGAPHCETLVPSNGVPVDLTTGTAAISITALTTFDTDTGAISGGITRDAGSGVLAKIAYAQTATLGMFAVQNLMITGPVHFTGSRAVALYSAGNITITSTVDVSGGCYGASTSCAGPGGGVGASVGQTAGGCGGGDGQTAGQIVSTGGGGGGGGGVGAAGGDNTAGSQVLAGGTGGTACLATSTLEPLVGGGGGGGGGPGGSFGGGGGGGLQLTAQGSIAIIAGAVVIAGGAGGDPGTAGNAGGALGAGGGGGAGGSILLEAPLVHISGVVAANGGGGGGGASGGQSGTASSTPATGGTASTNGTDMGGNGGAGSTAAMPGGSSATIASSGAGGGGVGRIYIRSTGTGAPQLGTVSPKPGLDVPHAQ